MGPSLAPESRCQKRRGAGGAPQQSGFGCRVGRGGDGHCSALPLARKSSPPRSAPRPPLPAPRRCAACSVGPEGERLGEVEEDAHCPRELPDLGASEWAGCAGRFRGPAWKRRSSRHGPQTPPAPGARGGDLGANQEPLPRERLVLPVLRRAVPAGGSGAGEGPGPRARWTGPFHRASEQASALPSTHASLLLPPLPPPPLRGVGPLEARERVAEALHPRGLVRRQDLRRVLTRPLRRAVQDFWHRSRPLAVHCRAPRAARPCLASPRPVPWRAATRRGPRWARSRPRLGRPSSCSRPSAPPLAPPPVRPQPMQPPPPRTPGAPAPTRRHLAARVRGLL
jgi:hypothetical protein